MVNQGGREVLFSATSCIQTILIKLQYMKPQENELLPIFKGQEVSMLCPDTRNITIRETNGNDDEILSNLQDFMTGDNFYKFLSDITLNDSVLGKKPSVDDVYKWPVNTINFVLVKQRVLNHGPLLEFSRTCQNPKCKQVNEFEHNLEEENLADLSKPVEPGLDNGRDRIIPYPMGADPMVEFKTSSGKKFRFKILTGELEKKSLDDAPDAAHQNTKLTMRELEVYNAGSWLLLTSFHGISSREMAEIRANVNKFDTSFSPQVDCTCPKCGNPDVVSLFTLPGFYFPVPKI
jgi:hypothetical protein